MLFTAAHELTHFIKENSPEHFEALEKIVTEGFTKKGLSIDALIDKQIEKAKNDGREISREDAREEMIADACETMLADGSLIKKLPTLKTENRGLWNAIKQFFENLFNKIDKLYRNFKPDSAEGKYIADMCKTAKKLKAAFAEGLTAVSEKTATKTKKTVGESTVKKSSRDSLTVVNIAPSNELLERINKSNKSKYSVIRDYLIEKFYGETFVLSDGIKAIMDKRDALELSHKANDLKSATLSNLRQVIEKAEYSHKADKVAHNKFDQFRYYTVKVSFDGDIYELLLNVGHSKFADEYHIYDITKNRRTANRSSTDLSQPVGNAMKNSSSIDSISHHEQNVNSKKTEIIKPSARSKNMSTGQINKLKANYTHEKVYSKKLAFDIISRFSSAGDFKAKTREAIAESLWEGLNGCTSIEERNTFAHDTASGCVPLK